MVVRIVIKVTHNDDFSLGLFAIDGIAYLAAEHSGSVTSRAAGKLTSVTAGPVVDNHMDFLRREFLAFGTFAEQVAGNGKLQTALDYTAVTVVRFEFVAVYFSRFEQYGVVQQSHVHATAVRAFYQNWFQAAAIFSVGFGAEVVETTDVLHLGYADTCSTARVVVSTQLRNGIGHVLNFVLVLVRGPFVATIGQVLVVVLTFVVDGIEQVLKVVESNTADVLSVCFVLFVLLSASSKC